MPVKPAAGAWDADAVPGDVRDWVVRHLGEPGAIPVIDAIGEVKKGACTVGMQRHYTGTAGWIENVKVPVYLTYATDRGHALMDRALYLPEGLDRRRRAAGRVRRDG